jgi:hypothetical protein
MSIQSFWPILYIAVVLILSAWLGFSSTNRIFPDGDAHTYGRAAYNLFQYGVFSSSGADTKEKAITNYYDNPVVPVYFAVVLKLFFDPAIVSQACLEATGDNPCPEALLAMKSANILWIWALSLLAFFILKDIKPNWVCARYAVFTLLAFNVSFLTHVDTFLTEGLSALFLLGFSFSLYKFSQIQKLSIQQTILYSVLGSVSYVLLVMLKAIYFYLIPLLILLAAIIAWTHKTWRKPILILLIVLCGYSGASAWEAHNQKIHGQKIMSLTGLHVLAVRAEYSTMTWQEYKAAYFAFLPDLGPLQLKKRLLEYFFNYEDYRRFRGMDENTKTFHGGWPKGVVGQRAMLPNGEIDYSKLKQAAFSVMLENWVKHIALIPVFALSGTFVTVGFLISPEDAPMAELLIKDALRYFTMFYSLFLYPSLFAALFMLWRRKEYALMIFFMPVLYSYAFHSVLTHFIPRYSMPAIPVLLIALLLVIGYIWQSYRKKRPQLTAGA